MSDVNHPLVIPIFIPHLGCPHHCAFCNQSIITQKNSCLPSEDHIRETILEFLRYRGQREQVELAFYGGNFLGLESDDIKKLFDCIEPFFLDGTIHEIRFSTRPDTITQTMLELIKPYQVRTVELGVQSMNNSVLKQNHRGHTRQDTIVAVEHLKRSGYKTGVQVMVGLPGDTEVSLMDSTRMVADLKPDYARIYPLLVLSGSQVERWYRKGEYTPLTLDASIGLSARMIHIFQKRDVRVIRVGLQASDMMEDESKVVAGPWHPAFGHLVFSQIMFESACRQIDQIIAGPGKSQMVKGNHLKIYLEIHPNSESRLRGDKNANIEKFKLIFPEIAIHIVRDRSIALDVIKARL